MSHLGTKLKVFQHLWTTKVKVSVTQTCIVIGLNPIFNLKRCCFSCIQHCQSCHVQLNRTSRQFIIGLLTRSDLSSHLDNKFATKTFSCCHNLCRNFFRVDNQLHDPFTVTKVDKDQTTQVTTTANPSFQGNFLSDMFLTNTTSIHTTFHCFSPLLFCYYFTIKAQALHENHQKSLIVFRNQNEQTKNPMKTSSDSLLMILNLFYAFQQSQLPF